MECQKYQLLCEEDSSGNIYKQEQRKERRKEGGKKARKEGKEKEREEE